MVIIISIWKYLNFVKCNSDTATELEILYEFSWFSGHINIKLQSKYHIISETVGILLLYWWFKTLCFYVHVPYLIWGPFWNDFTGSDYWCVLYSPLSKSCLLFEYQNCYLRLRVKIDCIFVLFILSVIRTVVWLKACGNYTCAIKAVGFWETKDCRFISFVLAHYDVHLKCISWGHSITWFHVLYTGTTWV